MGAADLSNITIEDHRLGVIAMPDYFWPLKTDLEPRIGNLPLVFICTSVKVTTLWNGNIIELDGVDEPMFLANNDYQGLLVTNNTYNEFTNYNDCIGIKAISISGLAHDRLFELFGESGATATVESDVGTIDGSPVVVTVGEQIKANVSAIGDLKVTFSTGCKQFACLAGWPGVFSSEGGTPPPSDSVKTGIGPVSAFTSLPGAEFTNDFCHYVELTPYSFYDATNERTIFGQGNDILNATLHVKYDPVSGNFFVRKRTGGIPTDMCVVAGSYARNATNKIIVKQESTGVTLYVDGVASAKDTTALGKADILFFPLCMGRHSTTTFDTAMAGSYKNLACFSRELPDDECISLTTHGIAL